MLRGQKHGIQVWVDILVDERHLELIFKIRARTKPLDDYAAAFSLGILSQKFAGAVHLNVGQVCGDRRMKSTRSSLVKTGFFPELTITQTISLSKIFAAR